MTTEPKNDPLEKMIDEAKAEFMNEYGEKNPYNLIGILEESMRKSSQASRDEGYRDGYRDGECNKYPLTKSI